MIADAMMYPSEIKAGDWIASPHTPQNVMRVLGVRTCRAECPKCFGPTVHVETDQGEVRFSAHGFTNGLPWSKIRK